MPDWADQYALEKQEVKDSLRQARAEARWSTRTGHACQAYVPSKGRKVDVQFLTDNQIEEVAQREAETAIQGAINRLRRKWQ